MSGRGPIRVLLANDVELVVKGLEALLAPYADRVTVVGTAVGDPDISVDALTASQTDVLLLDSFSRSGAASTPRRRSSPRTRSSRWSCSPRTTTSTTSSPPCAPACAATC
ncbi:MAG: hypothetical protein R2711_19080 [Acidimicrobiales bacterium]